jgi:uncharacterized protein (TIGR02391 family)
MSIDSECFTSVLTHDDTPVEVVAFQIVNYLKKLKRSGFGQGADKEKMGNRSWLTHIIGKQRIEEAGRKLMEAFGWLERNGLIVEEPFSLYNKMHVYRLSELGEQVNTEIDLQELQGRLACRKEILHQRVTSKCWGTFLKGDYSSSIFAAFKEIEVAVREAGCFTNSDIGVELMKKAFRSGGKLADPNEPGGEQNALAALFEGAVGRFRNPSAHRHMEIDSPEEAFEMLAFASHLMRIVEDRTKTNPDSAIEAS